MKTTTRIRLYAGLVVRAFRKEWERIDHLALLDSAAMRMIAPSEWKYRATPKEVLDRCNRYELDAILRLDTHFDMSGCSDAEVRDRIFRANRAWAEFQEAEFKKVEIKERKDVS